MQKEQTFMYYLFKYYINQYTIILSPYIVRVNI